MNRAYLALGVAAVLAAVITLYIVTAADGGAAATTPAPRTAETADRRPGKLRPPPRRNDIISDTSAGSGASRDYVVGDVEVRDHRSQPSAPSDVPPVIHAPEGRKLPSELTHGVGAIVRSAVAECAGSIARDARGPKPRFEGQLTIAIKNQRATIKSTVLQAHDLEGVAVDSIKQCIEQKSVGASIPSGDEPEIEGYSVTLSLRVP